MGKEREGLKQEIQNLNDNLINSLRTEQDEILERERGCMMELEESWKRITQLEAELPSKNKGEANQEINEVDGRIVHLKMEQQEGLKKKEVDLLKEDVKSLVKDMNGHEIAKTGAEEETMKPRDNILSHDSTNLSTSLNLTDSGVDLHSLTKLIVDVDAKLRGIGEPTQATSSEKYILETVYIRRNGFTDKTVPCTSHSWHLNIIIHRIKEDNTVSDQMIIKEIFNTVGLEHTSITSAIDRLGSKSSERTRPIQVSMKTETGNQVLWQVWEN